MASLLDNASQHGHACMLLDGLCLQALPLSLFEQSLMRRQRFLPVRQHQGRLLVAMAEPGQAHSLARDLHFSSGLGIDIVLVDAQALDQWLARLPASDDPPGARDQEATKAVAMVEALLQESLRQQASDLHFEPGDGHYRIRLRCDGLLQVASQADASLAARITAHLKVMAGLDIAERRHPQDGRMVLTPPQGAAVEFRISTLPTLWGEKIVMRRIASASACLELEQLGMEAEQILQYRTALEHPQGLILITGPTGSGKTQSLYAGLKHVNRPEVNITTAEDPVEIQLPGINQVNVSSRHGPGFASTLRALLRQDPDIIMIGEIRDLETAEIAIRAAQTGHLVLSTLHTGSAAQALTRLRNMGVPAFDIASSVRLVVAQRLVRRLCRHCREPCSLTRQAVSTEGITPVLGFKARPGGCPQCRRGYSGRIGIYEIVHLDEALQNLVMTSDDPGAIDRHLLAQGLPGLHRAGLRKVAQGLTSLDEVHRVIRE